MIGVHGCDSRPNPREWDVDVLGPANVNVPGPTVSEPSGAVLDANTVDVEVAVEDEE